jgi:hypothetical protein
MFGPGAACASANDALNCCAVIQWWISTTCRCISGRIVLPPPNDRRDSSKKSTAKVISRVTISGTSR